MLKSKKKLAPVVLSMALLGIWIVFGGLPQNNDLGQPGYSDNHLIVFVPYPEMQKIFY